MTSADPPRCGECGQPLREGAAFCRACGAAQGEAGAPGEAPPTGDQLPRVEPVPPAQRAAKPPRPEPGARGAAKAGPSNSAQTRPAQTPEPPPPVTDEPRRGFLAPLAIVAAILVAVGAVAGAIVVERGGSGNGDTTAVEAATSPGEAATPASEVGASGFPSVERAQMTQEIRRLLLGFHEDVVNGDFRAAWALLSPRKRRQDLAEPGGYQAWKSAQASLSPYLSPGGLRARIDSLEANGVVRVMLTGMGWSQPGSPCSEWSGLTWVKYEGEAWAYDPGYSTTAARRRAWRSRSSRLLGIGC